jgi:hypothetical protein
MGTHFISRLALLFVAGFLAVASQVWTGDTQDIIRCGHGMNPSQPVHGQPVRDQARDRQREAVEDRQASFASDRGS